MSKQSYEITMSSTKAKFKFKRTWGHLSREEQHEVLNLRQDVIEKVPKCYVPMMVELHPHYENKETHLYEFINGRRYDDQIYNDFKSLLQYIENEV